jgi:choline dehydrogenase-like flavoprotein
VNRDDVIVVGSGPSAVHAASALVENGCGVTMLDVGNEDTTYAPLIPEDTFQRIRSADAQQHRYFLGDKLEGVTLGARRVGAQLTAPRAYLTQDVASLTPTRSDGFSATESLALGGLGAGWGASAVRFDDRDLRGFPISARELAPHYERVCAEIGLSGARDDLQPFYGECATLQPPLRADPSIVELLETYRRKREALNRRGFYAGRPRLAVLSENLDDRRSQAYRDMDFYTDHGGSVYRPSYTLKALQGQGRFEYITPYIVERFVERTGHVEVHASHARDGTYRMFAANRLVLAAGALGSTRIVLRSMDAFGTSVPLLSNPHIYVPCVHVKRLGKLPATRRHSLTQAGFFFETGPRSPGPVYGEMHVYGSLLLHKLVRESRLPVRQATRLVRAFVSALLILVIEHEDIPDKGKKCRLVPTEKFPGGRLELSYRQDRELARRHADREKRLMRCVRRLACVPLGRVDPGPGSSLHYGGTVPMTDNPRELTVDRTCRLRGTQRVFLADGATFPWLPSKPLTLTLMANARRVAAYVAASLGR